MLINLIFSVVFYIKMQEKFVYFRRAIYRRQKEKRMNPNQGMSSSSPSCKFYIFIAITKYINCFWFFNQYIQKFSWKSFIFMWKILIFFTNLVTYSSKWKKNFKKFVTSIRVLYCIRLQIWNLISSLDIFLQDHHISTFQMFYHRETRSRRGW